MRKILFLISILFSSAFLYSQSFDLISSTMTLNDISSILKSTSAKDRLNAIYYLYNSTEDWAYNLLIEAYDKERDAYIKTQIIEVVSNKNQDKSFELTVKALEDDNPEIRRTGWISLNENIISDKVKLQRVKEIFRKEKKADIKIFGIKLFSVDRSTSATKELLDLIKNAAEDINLRKVALKKLSERKDSAAKNGLKEISDLKDKEISEEAKKLVKIK